MAKSRSEESVFQPSCTIMVKCWFASGRGKAGKAGLY